MDFKERQDVQAELSVTRDRLRPYLSEAENAAVDRNLAGVDDFAKRKAPPGGGPHDLVYEIRAIPGPRTAFADILKGSTWSGLGRDRWLSDVCKALPATWDVPPEEHRLGSV